MDYHQNARLTVHSREQLARLVVDRGYTELMAERDNSAIFAPAVRWLGKGAVVTFQVANREH